MKREGRGERGGDPEMLRIWCNLISKLPFYARNLADWFSVKSLQLCHQMLDFKAKMHQIRFPLGLRPSLQRSPRPPSWI